MCEECENPNALHLTYAEKRARMRAVWQPAGKSRMGFMATRAPTMPATVAAADSKNREDSLLGVSLQRHRYATIDIEGRTSNEAGALRGEECNHSGHFVSSPHSTDRNARDPLLSDLNL